MRGRLRLARIVTAVVAAGASASGPAGCGSTAMPARAPTSTAPVRRPPAPPAGPRVGATQRVKARGTILAVAVTRVVDPLRGSGVTLPPGSRAIGVFVRIRNRGPGTYDSSSTSDISISPSSGAASAAYAPAGTCQTQDRDFDNQIGTGETHTGCVAFTVDRRARVAGVRFSSNGGSARVASWRR